MPGKHAVNDPNADAEFAALADEWRRGRGPSSSIDELAAHPAYQKIIGMGTKAIPYLLWELERRPAQWFWALWEITRQDPVSDEDRGNLQRSVAAWLKWGKENGYPRAGCRLSRPARRAGADGDVVPKKAGK